MEPNKHIKLELRYDFTDAEITQIAKDQGQKMRDKAICEDEKKRSAKQYALRIETMEGEIEADTDKITSGYEMRRVECSVFYHTPKQGTKSIFRTDTNTLIREERMTETECQSTLPFEEAVNDSKEEQKALPGDEVNGWKLMEKAFPDHEILVIFRDQEGNEFAGSIAPGAAEGEVAIISDNHSNTRPTEDAIAWRHLTDSEVEELEIPAAK